MADSQMLLDEIDRRILRALQQNGRMQNIELGLSLSPCPRRVRVLEGQSVIERYTAVVNPAKVSFGMPVFAPASSWRDRTKIRSNGSFRKSPSSGKSSSAI